MNEALVAELDQEARGTRRVLERVPEGMLGWRPHPKSMSLGQLALHVATIPGGVSRMLGQDGIDAATVDFRQAQAESQEQLLDGLETSVAEARAFLRDLTPERAAALWRVVRGEREVLAVPRAAAVRSILLSHWIHHRAQLGVYLRLLDVPLPALYGNSADEDPLA